MRPAPLKGNGRKDLREDGDQALTPVRADDLKSGESSVDKVGEKETPFRSALGPGKTEVDYLFPAVMADA